MKYPHGFQNQLEIWNYYGGGYAGSKAPPLQHTIELTLERLVRDMYRKTPLLPSS